MPAVIANRDILFGRNGRRQWWLSAKTLLWARLNAGCIGIVDPRDILGQEENGFILF
jgi:hypothetical protein